ncbi:MAG TPA: hypothetical protein PKC30_12060 [Saprospiraceae bacterium]|nr:hypothetical protein [Saprospiraceae bacterium]
MIDMKSQWISSKYETPGWQSFRISFQIFILISILFSLSCDLLIEERPPSIDDPRVIRAAQKRVEDYKTRRLVTCRLEIVQDAEVHVDTTLARLIDRHLADLFDFPDRPERPLWPDPVKIDSGFVAAPLFDSLVFPRKAKDTSWFPENFPNADIPDSILKRYLDTLLIRKSDTLKFILPDSVIPGVTKDQ